MKILLLILVSLTFVTAEAQMKFKAGDTINLSKDTNVIVTALTSSYTYKKLRGTTVYKSSTLKDPKFLAWSKVQPATAEIEIKVPIYNPFDLTYIIAGKKYQMQMQESGFVKMVPMESSNIDTAYFAEYYPLPNFQGTPFLHNDTTINYNWPGRPFSAMPEDNFSVRWKRTGFFDNANYTFTISVDDGARLYIDEELVIDKWFGVFAPTTYEATRPMTRGFHAIRLEYFDNGGAASIFFFYRQAEK